ncbi:MAG TPA: bacteriocin [Aquifex aeolicus]|nr:bacteriocin [Aquifex aeolicus]
MDFLQRDQAPLTEEEWEQIDKTMYEVAKNTLIGRRFIPVVGPIGAGHQVISYDVLYGIEPGICEIKPGQEYEVCEPIRTGIRKHVPIPTLYKDFVVSWRDLQYWRQFNLPIDTTNVATAASALAVAEDTLIIFGSVELGIEGLLTAEGIETAKLSDWSKVGNAFSDVVNGISKLVERGFYSNYYLIVNPKRYFLLNRLHDNTGLLELEQIKKIVKDVYQTPIMPEDKVLLVSASPANFDLVIALDMTVAFVETSNMNHTFRVMEMVVPRIKRPESILVLSA